MPKEILFTGTNTKQCNNTKLEVLAVLGNEIVINVEKDLHNNFIYLDRTTAIKFHRELKKQISFLKMEGASNG